jgi:hypothetical protein
MDKPASESLIGGTSDRREFLTGIAALTAGVTGMLTTSIEVAAEAAGQPAAGKPQRVDFHHHYQSPEWTKYANSYGVRVPQFEREPVTNTPWTPARGIEAMDKAKYPNMRWVFSHAGGAMPYLAGRIIGGKGQLLNQTPKPGDRLYDIRTFYYDTAQSTNPVTMPALEKVVTSSQVVFGSDYPWSTIVDHVEGLQHSELNADQLVSIDRVATKLCSA